MGDPKGIAVKKNDGMLVAAIIGVLVAVGVFILLLPLFKSLLLMK